MQNIFGTKSEIDPNSGAHRTVKPHADACIAIVLARSWSDLFVCLSHFSNEAVCVRLMIHEQTNSSLALGNSVRNIRG